MVKNVWAPRPIQVYIGGRMPLKHWRMVTLWVPLLGGCGGSTDSEPFGDIAASYISTTFIVTPTSGSAEDVLVAGGLLTIGLGPNGTVTGTLDVPAGVAGAREPIHEDLFGTATRAGNTLVMEQSVDTFVRDMVWLIGPGTLTGRYVGVDGTVEVTLTAMQPD
jgi:hypothetical protein